MNVVYLALGINFISLLWTSFVLFYSFIRTYLYFSIISLAQFVRHCEDSYNCNPMNCRLHCDEVLIISRSVLSTLTVRLPFLHCEDSYNSNPMNCRLHCDEVVIISRSVLSTLTVHLHFLPTACNIEDSCAKPICGMITEIPVM